MAFFVSDFFTTFFFAKTFQALVAVFFLAFFLVVFATFLDVFSALVPLSLIVLEVDLNRSLRWESPSVDQFLIFFEIHLRDFLRSAGMDSYLLVTNKITGAMISHGRRPMLFIDVLRSAMSSFFSVDFTTPVSVFFLDLEIVFLVERVDVGEDFFGVFLFFWVLVAATISSIDTINLLVR